MFKIYIPLLLGAVLVSAQPSTVTGTMTVNKSKVVPKSAAAVGYQSTNGRLISVLLSDKAADPKQFRELTKVGAGEPLVPAIFEGAWKSLHFEKRLSGFTFTITADRQLLTNEFLTGGRHETFSLSSDDLVLELTSTSPRVTGRVRTKEPVLSVGGNLEVGLDVTFDVPVSEHGK